MEKPQCACSRSADGWFGTRGASDTERGRDDVVELEQTDAVLDATTSPTPSMRSGS